METITMITAGFSLAISAYCVHLLTKIKNQQETQQASQANSSQNKTEAKTISTHPWDDGPYAIHEKRVPWVSNAIVEVLDPDSCVLLDSEAPYVCLESPELAMQHAKTHRPGLYALALNEQQQCVLQELDHTQDPSANSDPPPRLSTKASEL